MNWHNRWTHHERQELEGGYRTEESWPAVLFPNVELKTGDHLTAWPGTGIGWLYRARTHYRLYKRARAWLTCRRMWWWRQKDSLRLWWWKRGQG